MRKLLMKVALLSLAFASSVGAARAQEGAGGRRVGETRRAERPLGLLV